ncbi:riboflavin synthase [Brevibacterium yomogidense]|uniref:riboflavin synthase n=1 Tax=Brevibacterium yomogidense TaxID=946573 RepID=UPI0018DF5B80|nr:riboflavin synthase [Brevibacterium yomogidense]
MFTGIIEEMGEVVSLTPTEAGSAVLTLRAGAVLDGLPDGGSLAVNGVCLTQAPEAGAGATSSASPSSPTSSVPPSTQSLFVAHVMGETLTRTTLGALQPGDPVNLERCPRAGDRFDGHIVQGHIDGTGHVVERVDEGDWVRIRIAVPADLAPFTAEKGSIALDGVSLTLSAVSPAPGTYPAGTDPLATDHWVEVGLIPATLAATRMGVLQVGDAVNVEVDIIAKYAARLTAFHAATAATTAAPAAATPHEGDLS